MLRYQPLLLSLICLSILAAPLCAFADEEIEDLIDIAESKGKIIAIIEGRKTVTFNLRPDEKVLWSGSRGYLGVFLTDHHFLVISVSSGAWQALPLKLDESAKGLVRLSPFIALLVAKDRAVGFDATANRFVETHLPLDDELIAAEAEKYVAVVITSSRVFGLAVESSAFIENMLGIDEAIEAVKLTSSKATVRTSERLLSFEASGSTWKESRF